MLFATCTFFNDLEHSTSVRGPFPIASKTINPDEKMSKNSPRVIEEPRDANTTSVRRAIGAWSWVFYKSCKLPFILMSVYVLLPYVTRVLIGNFVVGQALWARYAAIGGALAAVTLPLLGGSLDRLGPRKPWIAALTTLRIPLLFALWWATPDGSGVSASAVLMILALVSLLSACSEMMHTALLVPAVGMKRSGRFSGVSLGVANMFSVAVLTFMLWAFILPGKLHWPIIPAEPLFGLDQASHQPERLVGPAAAILLFLGTLPVLLFSPDVPRSDVSFPSSIKLGLRDTWQMAWGMRRERSLLTFLVARTLYNDGFLAGLAIAGVYAAGIMKWGPLELLSYGILKAVFAGIGAFIAGEFNAWLGPRRALNLELGLAVGLGLLVLGTTRNRILYFWSFNSRSSAAIWSGPIFRTLPELVYLGISLWAAAFAVASGASFRALLVRLIPVKKTGSYFGLLAFTSSITAWVVPVMIGLATSSSQSQRLGLLPISVFLLASLIALQFVKGENMWLGGNGHVVHRSAAAA